MKVSIITVVLNGAKTIEDCIKSVRSQTYPNIEHIIIDGESTDGTIEIINSHKDEISEFISEPDNGIYSAMNKGIRLSTGDIIATLNSDDMYARRSTIEDMVEFIEKNNFDAAYGDLVYVNSSRNNRVTRFWKAGEYKKRSFCHGWTPPHPTFFCHRRIFEEFGYFIESFRIAADFELMLRFIEKHQIRIGYLPEVLVKMRTGGRANRLRGIAQGNSEIIEAFRINSIKVSHSFFWKKALIKLSQVVR